MKTITVFLSDWQVLFREGIHFTLSGEEDIEVIGETTSSEEALSFIEANPPRVAVLNAFHDQLTGVEVACHLRRNLPTVAVVLIVDREDEEELFSVMKSGACACLNKDVDPDDVIVAVKEAAQGGYPISKALLRPGMAQRVLGEFQAFSQDGEGVGNLLARLTPGESEMLRHVAGGLPADQVAGALDVSQEVISLELESVVSKLVANGLCHEVIKAMQGSWSPPAQEDLASGGEYITRDEFIAFKESLKDIIGPPSVSRGGDS